MTETELRAMSDEQLQTELGVLMAEQSRRTRLSGASAQVAAIVSQVRADGGDSDQVIAAGCALADSESGPV